MSGQIVDATLVAAPRQRNTEDEKARIKGGESAGEIWPDRPAKARQKDTDARWTMNFSKAKPVADGKPQIDIAVPDFGYTSHVSTDRRHGIIRRAKVAAQRWGNRVVWRTRGVGDGSAGVLQVDAGRMTREAATRWRTP